MNSVETITLNLGGGNDTLSYFGSTSSVTARVGGAASGFSGTILGVENLTGGTLNDTLNGDAAPNILNGGAGDDTLDGGDDDDAVWYTVSPNFVTVNLEAGTAQDGYGYSDTLISVNRVGGSGYNDSITGDGSQNHLYGAGGNDMLDGAAGNDILIGGAGDDTLIGGDGSDTFYYQALSDRDTTGDVITDFTRGAGGDVLRLHELFQTFAGSGYNGTNAFTGGYLQFAASGADTLVKVDSGGGADSFVTMVTLQNVILLETDTVNLFL